MTKKHKDLAAVVQEGREILGQHAANEAATAKDFAARNAEYTRLGANARAYYGTPKEIAAQRTAVRAAEKEAANVAKAKLPSGMGGGKVAAIVAGVAVAGGALYMMTRKKEKTPEPVGPWTGRVASEQTGPHAGLDQQR